MQYNSRYKLRSFHYNYGTQTTVGHEILAEKLIWRMYMYERTAKLNSANDVYACA